RLQRKRQYGLRRQFDLLSLGRRLHAATEASARGCANSSPLAPASNSADDGADNRSCAHFFRSVLGSRGALTPVLGRGDRVVFASDLNPVQLQSQHRTPLE